MNELQRLLHEVAELLPPELVARASSYASELRDVVNPYAVLFISHIKQHGEAARTWVNETVAGYELDATSLILVTVLTCLVAYWAICAWRALLRPFAERGVLPVVFSFVRSLPPVAGMLERQKAKMKNDLLQKRDTHGERHKITALPPAGKSAERVLELVRERAQSDVQVASSTGSTLSGTIYMPAAGEHRDLLDSVSNLFSLTNPLHADAFPSIRQMEAEVVAMTAEMLGGGRGGANPQVCGAMTSGGTESILSAVKASRDYMAARKGIRQPEMIIGVSAHAAYWKAAEYFKIKLHVVPVGRDFRLSAATVRRYMNLNTAILVASAPGFPHGLVDDVKGIAALAARAGICCHVDACLGGFCLPFVRCLGREVPPFDFSVKGVTSMSVDTHKFGQAHKGTSVVLYAHPELRAHQYTRITDWTGGLYISPGLAGSRPGALIASAWASLVHLGRPGLLEATRKIMAARDRLVSGIELIPQLQVIGKPEMGVVAFRSVSPRALNVYVLNDWLAERGWHLNALQAPPALHYCFTAANAGAAPALVAALREGVAAQLADPAAAAKAARCGSAPVYGMANATPDRGMLGEFLTAYQDVMLVP